MRVISSFSRKCDVVYAMWTDDLWSGGIILLNARFALVQCK